MCKCCEAIKELQDIENAQEKVQDVKHILKARLTSISKRKGIRKEVGVINYKAYDLNYCPMCRTKISRLQKGYLNEYRKRKMELKIYM